MKYFDILRGFRINDRDLMKAMSIVLVVMVVLFPFANTRSAMAGDNLPPSGIAGEVCVSLNWNAGTNADFLGYNVYSSTQPGGPYSLVTTELLTVPTYSETNLADGTYYYVVTTVDNSMNESSYSDEMSFGVNASPTTTPTADIIIDNDGAGTSSTGNWGNATAAGNHYGSMSVYATVGGGVDTFRFTPDLPVAGTYDVYAWNSCYSNRATDVPHKIIHASGETTIAVDQDCDTGSSGEWLLLGAFTFDAGSGGYVEISDEGLDYATTTYIGADAVRFIHAGGTAPNTAPIAAMASPVVNGFDVILNGSGSSDPDDDGLTYNWEFGDGNTSNEPAPAHTYVEAGTYTITLTVNDGLLSDSVHVSVTVAETGFTVSNIDHFSTATCGAVEPLDSSFVTNNASALPVVGRNCDRYYAEVNDNTNDVTLHFNQNQGRLDAQLVSFPFEFIARNIGIGTISDSQSAPSASGSPYIFAGIQVHVTDLDSRNSSHVVIGHRGSTGFTIEGKNTVNGSSSVNDDGADVLPLGRGDIRIVGSANRTLTVYWQQPNLNPEVHEDVWQLYRGTGALPGAAPLYDNEVYVGLITYASGHSGVPFAGTADSIEWSTNGSGSTPPEPSGGTEIILDNDDPGTSSTGQWGDASAASNHFGENSLYATVGGTVDTYRYTPDIPATAEYDIAVWNSCFNNRPTDVPHKIVHAFGEVTIPVDQDCDTGSSGEWFNLGRFTFNTGDGGYLEISDEGLEYGFATYVGADAVRFTAVPNQAPIAVIATPVITDLDMSLDGGGSSDPDGDALTYEWDFGDGNSSTAQAASHTYAQAGIYTVILTVSDDQLASDTAQVSVTVSVATPTIVEVILDNIDSGTSSTGQWGDATGASNHYGSMSAYATVGGGIDTFRFTPDLPVAGLYDVYAWNSCYSNRATDVPHRIVHTSGETTIAVDQDCDTGSSGEWFFLGAFTFDAGSGGYLEISDEGLNYGTTTYIGADAVRFISASGTAPNTAPIAAMEDPVVNGFEVTFDSSESSDPDGDIITFNWNFGDGNTSAEQSPTHTYAQEGNYTVSLTVHDGSLSHEIQTAITISTSTPPSTPPPASGQAIEGFASVTSALDPTGTGTRYDVGGGNNFASELDGVPWQSLQPGDVVNIYYRTAPYRHKVLLSEQGTAANPIVINGVTNANGDRPTISAQDAVSINPQEWDSDYRMALIMINKRRLTGAYGVNAEHYQIQNLRLADARTTNSFTHNGVTENYLGFSRAIWSAGGQYITLQGMVIENNGSGVFIQANDDPGSLSKAWTIRGSKFENNGHGNRDHQVYFQAVSDPSEYNIVEGCYFGAPTSGQESIAQLKMRATGVVVRYNYFNSAHRTLDIVEAQDAIPDWMYSHYSQQEILDYYRTSYVYGNVFVNDHQANSGQPSTRPLHFGADSFDEPFFTTPGAADGEPGMRGYETPTYFFHNTFYMRADTAEMWRGSLFDTENNNSNGPTPTPGKVEAWNNIIEFAGTTRIGVMNRSGATQFRGTNLIHSSSLTILAESDQYANTENVGDDPDVTIVYDGPVLGQSANFVDATAPSLEAKNFMLNADSPAIGQAAPLPAVLAAFPVDLQPVGNTGGAVVRSSTQDLGALEGSLNPPTTNQAPIAVIGTPSINSLEMLLDGSGSSDPDGDGLTYDWDFGDGNTGNAQAPSHTYVDAGTYSITLTVSDDLLASDTTQISVTVNAPAPTPIDIIIDHVDSGAGSTGTWGDANGASGHYGGMSVYATVGGGIDTYRFTPDLPVSGQYNVYAWNSCFGNRHNQVPHRIVHADGETIVEVDQDCDTGSSSEWYLLGQYTFDSGINGFVEISDAGLDWPSTTYIGTDAVRFEQIDAPPPVVDTFIDDFTTADCDTLTPLGAHYTVNNESALPVVGKQCDRYYAELTDNTNNITLHYNGSQGRLDAQLVRFPFEVIVRDIGIGTISDPLTAPAANDNPYIFSGVQIHDIDLEARNSSHVVVGHRGPTHFTIEGKNTVNSSSSVNDDGPNIVPGGRADIRIVGDENNTLTVYWQVPNTNPLANADNWNLYGGTGNLPGNAPAFGDQVYLGLITYAFYDTGVPFVGTADSIEITGEISSSSVPTSATWEPPIGIPEPEFGIHESVTMYLLGNDETCNTHPEKCYDFGNGLVPYPISDSGNPYTHYVDNTNPNATDSNNPFGTPTHPRFTIPTNVEAGSVVEVNGGPYDQNTCEGGKTCISGVGTSTKPIFYRGPDIQNKTQIEHREILISDSEYLILENLDVYIPSHGNIWIRIDSFEPHHISVRNNHVYGDGSIRGNGGAIVPQGSDIVIYNNDIHDIGDWTTLTENDYNGVAVAGDTEGIWIVDNHIYHMGGDAVGSGHAANYTGSHYYIGRNDMHHNAENAVDLKEVSDVIISQNKMYGFRNTREGTASVVHYGPGLSPHNVWYLYNEIYDTDVHGIQIGGGAINNPDEIYVIGNHFHDIDNAQGDATAIMSWSSDNIYIIGNTIHNTDVGMDLDHGNDSVAIIENNLVSHLYTSNYIRLFQNRVNAMMHNNLNYNPSGVAIVDGLCIDCINTDPQYIDIQNNDVRLQANSPAIDAGIISEAYQTFINRFGIAIERDFDNSSRPQGAEWDIGVFENND